jgi:hypothetical protein
MMYAIEMGSGDPDIRTKFYGDQFKLLSNVTFIIAII